jgi:hypothetical protein
MKTTIYLVRQAMGPDNGCEVKGVFSSRKTALAFCRKYGNKINSLSCSDSREPWWCLLSVDSATLDSRNPASIREIPHEEVEAWKK